MLLRTPKDVGLALRDARKAKWLFQTALAQMAGASQGWLSEVENGKPTAELGKVLKVMTALGVALDARPAEVRFGQPTVQGGPPPSIPRLADVLARTTGKRT